MFPRREVLRNLLKIFDLGVMAVSFAFAAWWVSLRGQAFHSVGDFLALRVTVLNVGLFAGLVLIWHVVLNGFHLYQSRRMSPRWTELLGIMAAATLGAALVFAAGRLLGIGFLGPVFLAVFWSTDLALMIASRLVLRGALAGLRRRGRNLRYMLIAGTGRRAVDFARRIESKPELGYRIVGFADSDWPGLADFEKTGYRRVTAIEDFAAFIRENVVDEVVISLPLESQYRTASRVAALCQEQGIVVRCLSDIFDLQAPRLTAAFVDGVPLVCNSRGAMVGWQVEVKRLMDIVLAALSIVVLAPVMLAVAAAVALTSPGPVFFVHERIGLNKRHFPAYKFRTMVTGAEKRQAELEALNEVSGPVFKIRKDPRITPLGRVLRKLSLDELPQLFNVITGDMSLVGPRPLPIRDYSGFSQDWHRRRFSVRPGLTCLWQVNGRSDTAFDKWMELDMEYIDTWSLWLDVKILAKTIPAVLRGAGAA